MRLVAITGLIASPPGAAQVAAGDARPPTGRETVTGRARPGYAPIGIPVGGFRLFPSLEARGSYDSNIYALPGSPVDDVALVLSPRLTLRSEETRRYDIALIADAAITRYAQQTIENNTSGVVSATGRIEVDRDTQLSASLTAARRVQRRGTEDEALVGVLPPVAYRELTSTLGAERRFGPVTAALGGTVSQFRYGSTEVDGRRVSLRDNNAEQAGANARVAVAVGPAVGVFAAARYNDARYARSTRLPNRDSAGYALLGGVAFANSLINGEAGVGYMRQTFKSPLYRDISGINYGVRLNWGPTPLADIHLDVGRTCQRSALIGAAGIRLDRATISADYELLRNLLLDSGVTYTIADYRGLDRRDRRLEGAFGVRYLANRNLSLVGSISGAKQRRGASSLLSRDYDRVRITAGVRLQL